MNITDKEYSDIGSLDKGKAAEYAKELLESLRSYHQPTYEIREDRLDKGWGHSILHVLRGGDEVFSYERTYPSFGKSTCVPFPQYDFVDHQWHDYLLFSEEYVRASALNLETAVRADEPYPTDNYGKEYPEFGFCPTGFKAFPMIEEYVGTDEDEAKRDESIAFWNKMIDAHPDQASSLLEYSGVFALESGCIWGDDTSDKLRYIDTSRVRDGILRTDERYGYFELGASIEKVTFDDGIVYAPRLAMLDVNDGKVLNEE
jgi:hypothetical protein